MKLAVIPGDGIGTEVTAEALKVMRAALAGSGESIETTEYDLGALRYLRNGELLTDDDLASLREHDAILLGAVGDPRTVPSGVLEQGLLLKMRFALDHHVNLRPSVLYPGVTSPLSDPGKVDFIVVREGTEGLYAGNGGSIRVDTPHEVANETSVNTRYGVERVVRYAFDRAQERRKKLTLVHKTNVLVYAGGLWQRTVDQVAQEYPDPSRFDVIVTDNLFGDIITDLAGAVTGGIGLAASGNIDATGTNPSMFEPVHGSAPDIAGKGIADPTAAILSGALLFRHLGKIDEADAIEAAVRNDVASRDGSIRTEEVGTRIANSLDS